MTFGNIYLIYKYTSRAQGEDGRRKLHGVADPVYQIKSPGKGGQISKNQVLQNFCKEHFLKKFIYASSPKEFLWGERAKGHCLLPMYVLHCIVSSHSEEYTFNWTSSVILHTITPV